jgi:hypothetical protein
MRSSDFFSAALLVLALSGLGTPLAGGQEVFVGNPGKSLNFFHFDLPSRRASSESSVSM